MKTKPANSVDLAFRALSDWNRLRIFNLLREGELCVCDLVDVLQIPQPAASKHLAYLRKAKLVVGRKQGQWSYYRLAALRGAFQIKLAEAVAASVADSPDLAADSKRLAARGRSCCE
jgi:ArsR family transcriptional regulator